jgi:hypothetical protein
MAKLGDTFVDHRVKSYEIIRGRNGLQPARVRSTSHGAAAATSAVAAAGSAVGSAVGWWAVAGIAIAAAACYGLYRLLR